MPLLLDADKLLVGAGLSVNDLTYYLVPYNAVFRLTALAGAAEAVLTARLALAGTEGRAEAAWVVARTTPVLALVVAGVAAPLAAGMPELLDLWLGEDFALRSSLPAGILLVGITANAVAMPSHSTILGRMDTRVLPAVYGVETVLYVAVLYLLVGWLGLTGAAVAWSLRMVGDAAVQQSLAARSAPLGRRATLVGWGAVASVLGVVMLITGPLAGSALTRWTVGVSAGAAAFTALAAMPEGRLLARSLLRRPGGRS